MGWFPESARKVRAEYSVFMRNSSLFQEERQRCLLQETDLFLSFFYENDDKATLKLQRRQYNGFLKSRPKDF